MPPEDPTPKDIGTAMLAELLSKLGAVIQQSELNRSLLIEIRDLLAEDVESQKALAETIDELSGRLEVLSIAASICDDIVESNGKKSVTLADFCHAMVEANREVFPDDDAGGSGEDDDDEDDDGGGGQRVDGRPRARRI